MRRNFNVIFLCCRLKERSQKASCDTRFQRALTECCCVFKVITLAGSNQRIDIENANACSIRTLKTRVATGLKYVKSFHSGSFHLKTIVVFSSRKKKNILYTSTLNMKCLQIMKLRYLEYYR